MLESVCRPYCASAALGTRTNTIVPRIFVFIAAIAFFSLRSVGKLTPFRAGRCDRDHTPARQASFARQAASLPSSGQSGRLWRFEAKSSGRCWRKRVGVEPTRDRLAAPHGFEVRAPHRGRFSSTLVAGLTRPSEQIQAMPVDPPLIAFAQGQPMPIEEVEDLDRHLAAVVDLVAELRGRERAALRRSRQLRNDCGHLPDCRPQEEM